MSARTLAGVRERDVGSRIAVRGSPTARPRPLAACSSDHVCQRAADLLPGQVFGAVPGRVPAFLQLPDELGGRRGLAQPRPPSQGREADRAHGAGHLGPAGELLGPELLVDDHDRGDLGVHGPDLPGAPTGPRRGLEPAAHRRGAWLTERAQVLTVTKHVVTRRRRVASIRGPCRVRHHRV
jgi:hypothetical protein